MLRDCINSIEAEIEYELDMRGILEKKLARLENLKDKKLIATKMRGKVLYYLYQHRDGVEKRKYLNQKETSLRERIQLKFYLEEAIKRCNSNIDKLDSVLEPLKEIDPKHVSEDAPLAYREQRLAHQIFYGFTSDDEWKNEKLKNRRVYDDEETYIRTHPHIAIDGTRTRSKSEAAIIQLLYSKKIPHVYETTMHVNGVLREPDFVLLDTKTGREYILEHLGMMGDDDYRRKQYKKLGEYIEDGYTPNERLILTFEDKSGYINLQRISEIIDLIMK